MNTVAIREYTDTDKAQLAQLFEEFHGYIMHIDPMKRHVPVTGHGAEIVNENLKQIQEQEGKWYVAVENGTIVGFVIGIIEKPKTAFEKLGVVATKPGRITELYIEALSRGKGIGTKLMEKLESYFKEQGCDVVKVEVFAPNTAARNLYTKLGFGERNIDMIKKV